MDLLFHDEMIGGYCGMGWVIYIMGQVIIGFFEIDGIYELVL